MKFRYIFFSIICIFCNITYSIATAQDSCSNLTTQEECKSTDGCMWGQSFLGDYTCIQCSAGYYCTGGEKIQCVGDTISIGGAASCTACPDRYSSDSYHRYCHNDSTSTDCSLDSDSKFVEATISNGDILLQPNNCPCIFGSYWSDGTCVKCETNSVSLGNINGTNVPQCTPCPTDYTASTTNGNICQKEKNNKTKYCALTQQDKFKQWYNEGQRDNDSVDCICVSGKYEDFETSDGSCTSCPVGNYCDEGNKYSCPFGKTTSGTGKSKCENCDTDITNIMLSDNYSQQTQSEITLSYHGACPSNP